MTSIVSSSEAELSSLTDEEERLGELTNEELYNLVQDCVRECEVLKIETGMFESFMKRVDPKDLEIQTGIQPQAPSTESSSNQRTFRKGSRSRGQSIDKNLRLTAEQKCDIAMRELEELRDGIEIKKEQANKKMDNFRAVMEEADIRYAEVKKSQYEFNRDTVNAASNPPTNKVIAEKFVRSIEDKLKSQDTLVEKLRLKNSTLKVQKKKLRLQLKQKEEMGEVLHEVDFNQLKIENSQYLEKIDERNQDLLRLKLMATNVIQVLNAYKKKLHVLTMESDRLQAEISQRKDLLARIENEEKVVESEKQRAENTNKHFRQQLSDFKVPDVVEYVKEKADLYELRKAVRNWERKVEIASMALKTHLATWNNMKAGQPPTYTDETPGVKSSSWTLTGLN